MITTKKTLGFKEREKHRKTIYSNVTKIKIIDRIINPLEIYIMLDAEDGFLDVDSPGFLVVVPPGFLVVVVLSGFFVVVVVGGFLVVLCDGGFPNISP